MIRTVLFDLDGTLTDSREGIVNSVKYTVEKLGGPMPDPQTLLKFIGPPLQESFMEYCGYSREKAVEGVQVFREQYVPVGQYENAAREMDALLGIHHTALRSVQCKVGRYRKIPTNSRCGGSDQRL